MSAVRTPRKKTAEAISESESPQLTVVNDSAADAPIVETLTVLADTEPIEAPDGIPPLLWEHAKERYSDFLKQQPPDADRWYPADLAARDVCWQLARRQHVGRVRRALLEAAVSPETVTGTRSGMNTGPAPQVAVLGQDGHLSASDGLK